MTTTLYTLLACLLLAACGSGSDAPAAEAVAVANPSGLSAAQLEHGIGPIEAFEPGPLDAALAERGAEYFKLKCSACHKMDTRYVGPPLATITQTRSPAYIMNMMLNPAEMLEKHPEAKAKLAEFMSLMPNQNLTQDEARAILEYLREQAP
ncbi:MAG: cytochrome c [Bacteroidetes bacterium]|nr:cytochrome c [Bacteroidota bacterium]MDA0875528.1 cytochrome c [Bacteroidota bacterium]